jgi:hypothetical protein
VLFRSDLAMNCDEHILKYLFRIFCVASEARSEAKHLVTVSREELFEALLIPLLKIYNQLLIGSLSGRHTSNPPDNSRAPAQHHDCSASCENLAMLKKA